MAYSNAIGMTVPIFYVCMCLLSFWHAHCKASSLPPHGNAKDVYEQTFVSKPKVGKHHPPHSSARLLTHPPAPPAIPKSPSSRPGQQAPLSVVESEAAFSLYYGRNFKVVQNFFFNFTYLLLKEAGDSIGKDWDLNISVFQDPVTNFTIDTSSAVGFLELLGCVGKLRGVPASFGVASPCIWQLISQGGIPTIEIDSNLMDLNATSSNKSFEALFGSSNKYINVQLFSNEENQSNYISFDSSMDRGPLQRAEWIKFFASFFDLEVTANNIYGQTLNVVIDETYAPDPSAYTLNNFTMSANISDMNGFPFLVNKRHWRYDKRVGINNALAWMEDAIAQPQIVLRDLIEVFYPAPDGQTAYNTTYFRNIAKEESFVNTTSLLCSHPDMASVQPTIIPCTIDSVF